MKNKLYCFIFNFGIKRYSTDDLNVLYLENVKKINDCKCNSRLRHILILQNRCIKKRLSKLCYNKK